ncbi:response regulator [Mucilaginibacter endophyticus]|uniref:response regulator n=1 Tax=Mucilaginibacter endophyticus TaxID=2675003 RepID=UPI000E0D12CF|nr:response regulator [Mucilaginibacter endophyticus]
MTPKHILLIEDSNAIADIVCALLEEQNYKVTHIPHQPVETLAAFNCHLIVLDEWLNARQSHMYCLEIKALRDLQHIPVIIFSTALDIEEIRSRCGADGSVRKPFDVDELINEVRRCCP